VPDREQQRERGEGGEGEDSAGSVRQAMRQLIDGRSNR
jgi:hypothetical protein